MADMKLCDWILQRLQQVPKLHAMTLAIASKCRLMKGCHFGYLVPPTTKTRVPGLSCDLHPASSFKIGVAKILLS